MRVQLKVANGSKAGQTITINRPKFLIGRAEDCHLKPKSDLVSRYHCAILSEEGYVAVRDLGSRNGVFVNGEKAIGEEELHNGDHLTIGPLEFEVVLSVTLASTKKPKVESIADVVARTVARDSKSTPSDSGASEENEEDAAMDWLLGDEVSEMDDGELAATIQAELPTGKTEASSKAPPKTPTAHQKIPTSNPPTGKAPAPKTAPSPKPADPDQAANMLKNFFQNH